MKDTGKGRSREEAQQQAAEKVNSPFHFNRSSSSKTKTPTKTNTTTKKGGGTTAGCREGEFLILFLSNILLVIVMVEKVNLILLLALL